MPSFTSSLPLSRSDDPEDNKDWRHALHVLFVLVVLFIAFKVSWSLLTSLVQLHRCCIALLGTPERRRYRDCRTASSRLGTPLYSLPRTRYLESCHSRPLSGCRRRMPTGKHTNASPGTDHSRRHTPSM